MSAMVPSRAGVEAHSFISLTNAHVVVWVRGQLTRARIGSNRTRSEPSGVWTSQRALAAPPS